MRRNSGSHTLGCKTKRQGIFHEGLLALYRSFQPTVPSERWHLASAPRESTQTVLQKKRKNMRISVNGTGDSDGFTSKDLHIIGVISASGGNGCAIDYARSVIGVEADMSAWSWLRVLQQLMFVLLRPSVVCESSLLPRRPLRRPNSPFRHAARIIASSMSKNFKTRVIHRWAFGVLGSASRGTVEKLARRW
ncbi:hypothetical protein C8F01DRAFT_490344 [Mycena amicta]|nr:hypothetical protein C8F01DRAFT_490344 [Mycena amicta]